MNSNSTFNIQEAYLNVYNNKTFNEFEINEKFQRFKTDVVGDKVASIKARADLLRSIGRHDEANRQINRGETIASNALRMGGYVDDEGNKISEPGSRWTRANRDAELKIARQKQRIKAANTRRGKKKKELERVFNMPSVSEGYNHYNIIISHLLDEGYADCVGSAEIILENMSDEWLESILG